MYQRSSPSKRYGFSLIELLATLAVISVLSAVIIAAIAKAQHMAAVTNSVSNLRQVGLAYSTYAAENGNSLPNKSEPGKGSLVSSELMDPYLDYDDPAWICPIMKELEQGALSERDRGRYIYSWRLTNFNDGWRDRTDAIRLDSVVNPSQAMVAANLSAGGRGGYWDGYASVLFVDGNVDRVADPSYLGGDVNQIEGVNRLYLQTLNGELRGYDF